MYFAVKGPPLSPPFKLDAPDVSRPRPKAEQEKIWKAYEDLVAWSGANLRVVTSKELVRMAEAERPGAPR
jgi:hypothetical protein